MSGERPAGGRRLVADAVAARRRAELVSGLRGLARPDGGPRRGLGVRRRCTPSRDEARVLRPVRDRRSRQTTATCCTWPSAGSCARARRAGRCARARATTGPTGNRTLWLPDLDVPDDLWAGFQIPIGLAFFMDSTVTACVVAMYPSPAGATESRAPLRLLEPDASSSTRCWRDLEPDIEGLIVNRLSDPPVYVIAPIDRCYALTGTIKATWEGISGGRGVEQAVTRFFDDLRADGGSRGRRA